MKIVIYFNKNDDSVNEVSQLNNEQWSNLIQNDSVEKFNASNNYNVKAMIFDTEVENIPKEILDKMLLLLVDKKQVKLRDIILRLKNLEESIDSIDIDFNRIKDKIEEVLVGE